MAGPDGSEDTKDRSGWVKENKCLGSGGFGTVALWHHKVRCEDQQPVFSFLSNPCLVFQIG